MSDLKIRRALIAVYDKTGITEFARALVDEFGIEILSTGGTARHLKEAGIPVTLVEEVTGFPEMLDGRVKTLHPKVHAGILADRDNPEHMRQLEQHGIQPIDMVVVNLYPFEKTVADPNCTFEQAIEMIDIGGPCMLRAAAKNHKHVLVVPLIPAYEDVLRHLRRMKEGPALDPEETLDLYESHGANAFVTTARYDTKVSHWLEPHFEFLELFKYHSARYGENPHQTGKAYIFRSLREATLVPSGKPIGPEGIDVDRISFNNYVDGDAALSLVKELTRASKEPRASARAASATSENSSNAGTPDVSKAPRASARAASRTAENALTASGPTPISLQDFSVPDWHAPAWFLTWTTYGQWLPGDERGFVSRRVRQDGTHELRNVPATEWSADEPWLREVARERMQGTPVALTSEQAACAYEAILDTARRHGLLLIAVAVMANHVHVLCQSDKDGSALLQLLKGNSSSQLNKRFTLENAPRWWTKSGSKQHIRAGDDLSAVIDYIRDQEHPLRAASIHEALATEKSGTEGREAFAGAREAARAEARGALVGVYAVAFIKHTNACGCAVGDDPVDTYRRAYLGDPIAAAGGVLCMNFPVTREIADTVMNSFGSWGRAAGAAFFKLDVWIAPSFDEDAIPLITTPTEKRKWGKECRLLAVGPMDTPPDRNEMDYKKITGGMLVQTRDLIGLNEDQWKVVTKRAPSESEMADLRFAWLVCKHTKSNAITICRDGCLLGNGAGQMSRVKSCDLAIQLARENGHGERLAGAVAAGDAFFPVPDGPQKLIDAGITAIIHPGGSNRDAETVAVCDAANVAMIMTGTRHFKH
jgi:AICAR transformylase/IMP cyclohydrolase PurH/REP element-mobilizing transposase RayT